VSQSRAEREREWNHIVDACTSAENYRANMNEQIENNFTYHAPKEGQPLQYEVIRAKAKELAYLIDGVCPNSREKSLAMTNLEQSVFWANAAIARNG
jgi:hypothetical protein